MFYVRINKNVDKYWGALTADGGKPVRVAGSPTNSASAADHPQALEELMGSSDPAVAIVSLRQC